MNIEQIDALIETAELPRDTPNIIFMGSMVYDRLVEQIKVHATFPVHSDKFKKLLLPALEYRDILIIRSPVVPEECAMSGYLSLEELAYQKELIGWG